MDDAINYFGATIFWLYIVAALVLTSLAITNISSIPRSTTQDGIKRRKAASIFVILSAISFMTLSFNMLHVLFQSYGAWAVRRALRKPSDLIELFRNVRHWSISSALFLDFGEAIVADESRILWTQSALLATLSVCLFMGSEGHRHSIPRLWVFFGLSQILPVSFALNLFYTALLYLPRPTATETLFPQTLVFAGVGIYTACLLAAPYSAKQGLLIPTILTARAMLLLPLLSRKPLKSSSNRKDVPVGWCGSKFAQSSIGLLAIVLTVKQAFRITARGLSVSEIGSAPFSHPAVAALGFDFVLCSFSFLTWHLIEEPMSKKA